jgi:hypothetical protein
MYDLVHTQCSAVQHVCMRIENITRHPLAVGSAKKRKDLMLACGPMDFVKGFMARPRIHA